MDQGVQLNYKPAGTVGELCQAAFQAMVCMVYGFDRRERGPILHRAALAED